MKDPARLFAPASALLALVAFSPVQRGPVFLTTAPFLFVALFPLLLRLADPRVRPFRCGYGFGLIYGVGQFWWVGVLTYRWTGSHGLGLVPMVTAVPLYAVYFGLIVISAALVLTPGMPLGLLTNAVQTLAGVLLPSATVFLLLLCNDKDRKSVV